MEPENSPVPKKACLQLSNGIAGDILAFESTLSSDQSQGTHIQHLGMCLFDAFESRKEEYDPSCCRQPEMLDNGMLAGNQAA
jgi:hypothetical protein